MAEKKKKENSVTHFMEIYILSEELFVSTYQPVKMQVLILFRILENKEGGR